MKKPDWKAWLRDRKECRTWYEYYKSHKMIRKTALKPDSYMKKAVHNMDFANWVLDRHKNDIPPAFRGEKFYDWVIIAYYYAIYHAALSLIAAKGLSSKSHMATLSAVVLFFYHEKKIGKEDVALIAESIGTTIGKDDIELIIEAKSLRERASYGVGYEFDEMLVKRAQQNAASFIEKARQILGQ
jgi:uncharacterized protein (UPF0332 family)